MQRTFRVKAQLPFRVRWDGVFPAGPLGPNLHLTNILQLTETDVIRRPTSVEIEFECDDSVDQDGRTRVQTAEAVRLIQLTNRFLRWYRTLRNEVGVFEVTRAQVSPFRFFDDTGQGWGQDLIFEPSFPVQAETTRGQHWESLIAGFASGGEPDIADLALADARVALSSGRFREAVLLCWSAIDSTFTRRFQRLVDERLDREWSEAKKFLKGFDFGLRQKMTAGMRLLTGRSFFELPNNFWSRLSDSYTLRNRIIHAGQNATEDEARQSIDIADELILVVRGL